MKSDAAGSLEEVILFATSIGAGVTDARYFWFKCEGNGWQNHGKPIRNWRATFLCWWEAKWFPSQREKYKSNGNGKHLPSAHEVRRVIDKYRDRFIGYSDDKLPDAWERVFRSQLGCSREDAMKVLNDN